MGMRTSAIDPALIRSEGPTFDQQIQDEDMAGAVFSGVTPLDLGLSPKALLPVQRPVMRGIPECVRGTGTTLRRSPRVVS